MPGKYIGRAVTLLRVVFARLRFVAVFVVAALVVGYWDDIRNYVDKWTRPPTAPDSLAAMAASNVEYFCPMHPEVVRAEMGQCPKCGMPLVKRKKGEAVRLPEDVVARVQLTPQRIALANVGTSAVELLPLTVDTEAVGVLDYDETKLARLSARVAGRADDLYVTFAGQAVKRDDPLYSLYSPEVYTAQREYLTARKRVNDLPPSAGADVKSDASALYNAALQKLVLWGITTRQLGRLDEEYDKTGRIPTHLTVTSPISGIVVRKQITQGQYLQVGDAPYTVADLSVLWLQLKLYERDIPVVNVGDTAEVSVEAVPGESFTGTVVFKGFQLDPSTRTLDARLVMENPGLRLRPGMFANAILHVPVVAAAGTTTANGPATAPATSPATVAATTPAQVAEAYAAALQPYLKAHKLLSEDKAEGVAALLQSALKALEPARDADAIRPTYKRLADAVARTPGQPLKDLRMTWKDVSAAMIEMGKAASLPADAPVVKVYHCPMQKANWLQAGDGTANPYYGAEMYTCGSAVEALPKLHKDVPGTRPAPESGPKPPAPRPTRPAAKVLAVPRPAVIDTGRDKIVYVESAPGVYDMKSVKLGPRAGDHYPVIAGLREGERVVTAGAFLIDAENRLNPTKSAVHEARAPGDSHRHPQGSVQP